MKPIQVVTIGKITPLFKGEEKAERIELINLEENGFDLVCGKDMYEVGQKAIFIQPDYNVSDISLFDSYIRPGGDESKSMLGNVGGKPRRIRAKKFNFHTGDNEPVYSNGILLRVGEVAEYLGVSKATVVMSSEDDLADSLGIVKYEEPENNSGGNVHSSGSAPFPSGIYKTDEDNIKNQWGRLENRIGYPVTLVGTEKVDGCLPYFQKINMWDGTSKRIYDINIGDVVQGYCHITNAIVPSKVLNKVSLGKTDKWYSLNIKSNLNNRGRAQSRLFCTENHKIYSEGNYKKAKNISVGDKVVKTITDYKISKDVEQILIGKILGDGSLDVHNALKWAMTFGHCKEQKDYLLYLRDLLGDLMTDNIDERISGYGSTMFRSRTKHSSHINTLFEKWLETGNKQIPKSLTFTPLSLCFWYLDDGSLQSTPVQQDRVVFSICSYNTESRINLDQALTNFGFNNYTFFESDGYWYVRLNASDTKILFESIHTLVPESMQYKLSSEYRGKFIKPSIETCNKEMFEVEGFISNIEIINSDDFIYKTKTKWDIETETSNFFSSEILIHNSSISIGIKDGKGFICSRNLGKKLEIKKVVGRRRKNFIERLLFWTKPDLNIYELVPNDYDDFVKYGRPYLDAMFAVDLDNVVLRGELNGGSMKGSGNKNNPAAKEPVNIKFFGCDYIENGIAVPQNYFVLDSLCNFIRYNLKIEIETVPLLFEQKFNNREEIEDKCKNIFKDNMIEGIVLRNLDSTFSAKYMNDAYDSKK